VVLGFINFSAMSGFELIIGLILHLFIHVLSFNI